MMAVSPELAAMLRRQLGLGAEAELPLLDTFLAERSVLGTQEDLQWLQAVCCTPGEGRAHLNLGRIRHHLQRLIEAADSALVKSMRMARDLRKTAETEAVTLDQAADVFYGYCYPEVQTCIDIAVEQLEQPRARIILAALGHYKDELHGVDMTNALDVQDLVPGNVTPFPHRGSATPLLQHTCPVCQSPFAPSPQKPKQLYCGEPCGSFAYASVQTWAYNAVAYEGMGSLPWPDPYPYGIQPDRWPMARAWQEIAIPKALADHERRAREQRARA